MEIITFLYDIGVKPFNHAEHQALLWTCPWDLYNCQEEYITLMGRAINSGFHCDVSTVLWNLRGVPISPYGNASWKGNLSLILTIDEKGTDRNLARFPICQALSEADDMSSGSNGRNRKVCSS